MKSLSCADMGVVECHFVAEGNTDGEVVAKLMAHAETAHPDKVKGMTDAMKAEMEKEMVAKMKEI